MSKCVSALINFFENKAKEGNSKTDLGRRNYPSKENLSKNNKDCTGYGKQSLRHEDNDSMWREKPTVARKIESNENKEWFIELKKESIEQFLLKLDKRQEAPIFRNSQKTHEALNSYHLQRQDEYGSKNLQYKNQKWQTEMDSFEELYQCHKRIKDDDEDDDDDDDVEDDNNNDNKDDDDENEIYGVHVRCTDNSSDEEELNNKTQEIDYEKSTNQQQFVRQKSISGYYTKMNDKIDEIINRGFTILNEINKTIISKSVHSQLRIYLKESLLELKNIKINRKNKDKHERARFLMKLTIRKLDEAFAFSQNY